MTIKSQIRGTLIVEDDPLTRDLLVEVLAEEGNRPIFQAAHGQEALDVLVDHIAEIELMILDYKMPGMNADELLRLLPSLVKQPLGIVMISLHKEIKQIVESVCEPGLHLSYIYKPFEIDEFLLRVESVRQAVSTGGKTA